MVRTYREWTTRECGFIRANAGKLTAEEIGAALRRSKKSVCTFASRRQISLALTPPDDHDVWLCRELYKEGLSVAVIAKKMELGNKLVSNIIFENEY